MHPIIYFFLLIPTFLLLGKSADILLENLTHLGHKLRWSKFLLGFIILGVATSSPEFFVALSSSITQIPELSLGNLLGGIVVLFSLVIGLQALFQKEISTNEIFARRSFFNVLIRLLRRELPFRRQFLIHDLIIVTIIVVAPLILLIDRELSRLDGALLIILYAFYIIHSFHIKKIGEWEILENQVPGRKIVSYLFLGFAGLITMSWLAVFFSKQIIYSLNILPIVFGFIVLALGTNLPEITIAVKSRKKHGELAVGNVFGSSMANILIAGILPLLKPFEITNWQPILVVALSLILITACLMFFLKTKNKLERYEGAVLIGVYFIYLLFVIFFER